MKKNYSKTYCVGYYIEKNTKLMRMGVKGSARRGWVVDWAPTGKQNDGTASTLLPIKLIFLASQSRRLD